VSDSALARHSSATRKQPGHVRSASAGPARTDPRRQPASTAAERLSQLERLFEVTRMIASELNLADISHQILVSAIEMIPAAEAGTLYLTDSATGRLQVQDTVGLGPSIRKLSLEPGECAAGKAFFSRRGAIYNDPEAVNNALAGASTDNLAAFREATQGLRSPKAAISVPLVFKGDVLGALVVDKLRDGDEPFSARDQQLLEEFGQIAAIGIVNARLFDSEHSTRLRLQALNFDLNRQRDLLDKRLRALDAMAVVAREGSGLDTVVNRLATLAGGNAAILDGLGRVRAAAPANSEMAITARQSPATELLERANRDRQRHSTPREGGWLIASPVTAELEVLGDVLLELTDAEPDGLAETLVDSAALIASPIFLREQVRAEGDLQRRADLLERLLNGDPPQSAAQFHELWPPFRLAVGAMERIRDQGRPSAQLSVVLRELRTVTAEMIPRKCSALAVTDERVVVAWSVSGSRQTVDWRGIFAKIAAEFNSYDGWRVRFALTPPIDDPQAVPQGYREAKLALEIRPWSGDPVMDVGQLGAYRLIIGATSSGDAVELSRKTLAPVLAHDRKRGGNLLPTFRTFLATGMSPTAAAQALHVHVHTVQYRLAKLEQLTGLSLRNSEERLTLELSMRIYDLSRLRWREFIRVVL
jgi:PucR C-terminal helix-turn-helix domain/GAF domain/GGDEF-like domain